MNFFQRFKWAWAFSLNTPSFREFGWTPSDRSQTDAFLRSAPGMKMLQQLQNRVTMEFYDGASSNRPDISQRALGRWNAIASIKILSEGEPSLAQLAGIPAPDKPQATEHSSPGDDPLDHLYRQ